MYRIIYSVVFYLAIPIILLRLLLRSIKVPAYRQRLAERFAFSSPAQEFTRQKQAIWVHAVSVGETVASAPLVTALQQR
jgi:3-deoxy-D-manno-octulosonic-acid transferase